MESSASSQTRDRPQERRARTKTTTTTTSTPTQSSSPAPTRTKVAQRKSTKSIPRKKTEAPVYATKYQAVLAEKVVNGRVKYLVNWANDPKTGDPYEPTWEPKDFVTAAGTNQWEAQKAEGLVVKRGEELVLEKQPTPTQDHTIQDTAVPKRKRDQIEDSSSQSPLQAKPPRSKKVCRAGTANSVKQVTDNPSEAPDSYEEVTTPTRKRPARKDSDLLVQVAFPEGFDKSAYHTVAPSQSQTQVQSHTQESHYTEVEPESSQIAEDPEDPIEDSPSSHTGRVKIPRSFARFVIPDSQEQLPASDSWRLSEEFTALTSSQNTTSLETEAGPSVSQVSSKDLQGVHSQAQEHFDDSIDFTYSAPTTSTTASEASEKSPQLSLPDQLELEQHSDPLTSAVAHTSPAEICDTATSSTQSLHPLTPTRQRGSSEGQASSPSSQLIFGSVRHPQPNSQDNIHSQSQLLSPDHDKSISREHSLTSSQQAKSEIDQLRGSSYHILPSIEASDTQFRQITNSELGNSPTISVTSSSFSSSMDIDEGDADAIKAADREARRLKIKHSLEEKLRAALAPIDAEYAAKRAALIASRPSAPSEIVAAPNANIEGSLTPKPEMVSIEVAATTENSVPVDNGTHAEAASVTQSVGHTGLVHDPQLRDHQDSHRETEEELVPDIEQLDIEQSEAETVLDVLHETDNEYFIGLPMNAGCRKMYADVINASRRERLELLRGNLDQAVVTNINTMVTTLDLLCSHPDLHSDDYATQRMDTFVTQAKYAENRSTKCIFVAELLDEMREKEKHIVIVARPGRMIEILVAILKYHKFVDQSGTHTEFHFPGGLRVSLIPSDLSSDRIASADLVVAFDSTFSHQPFINTVRSKSSTAALAPLIHLVVAHSIEHIERVIPKTIDPEERQVRVVGCLTMVETIGMDTNPTEIASDISSFVMTNGDDSDWPCETLPIIAAAQVQEDSMRSSESPVAYHSIARSNQFIASSKRHLEDDSTMDVDSPKRQRLTPVPGDFEHISSQIPSSSLLLPPTSHNLFSGVRGSNSQPKLPGTEARLTDEVAKLRSQLREKEETELQIRQLNKDLHRQLVDLRSSISVIQPKYQEALNDRAEFEHQAKTYMTVAESHKANLEVRQAQITKLKEEKEALSSELQTVRGVMASSANPDIVLVAQLQVQVRTLTEENAKLERQKKAAQSDTEYMRESYQTASSAAVKSGSALQALESQVTSLREQASANKVKIHEIQRDQDKAGYLRMVRQLKIQNAELQRELDKKAGELAAAMNGRRSTRGTSTPMSPGGNSYVTTNGVGRGSIGRVMQQQAARSRGSSPSVAERAVGNAAAATATSQTAFAEMMSGNGNGSGSGQGNRFAEVGRRT